MSTLHHPRPISTNYLLEYDVDSLNKRMFLCIHLLSNIDNRNSHLQGMSQGRIIDPYLFNQIQNVYSCTHKVAYQDDYKAVLQIQLLFRIQLSLLNCQQAAYLDHSIFHQLSFLSQNLGHRSRSNQSFIKENNVHVLLFDSKPKVEQE